MELKKSDRTDAKKIQDGVWMDDEAGSRFLLTYFESTKATMYFQMSLKRFEASGEHDKATCILLATRETLIEVIVLGWENLKEDGVLLEYSKEELRRLLDSYENMGMQLMNMALKVEQFRQKDLEDLEKK